MSSRMTIFIINESGDNAEEKKMSDGGKHDEIPTKPAEQSEKQTLKHGADEDPGPPDAIGHEAIDHSEDVASSLAKSVTPNNTFPKKIHRSKDNLCKMTLSKLDGRPRHKIVSDPRFLYSGNDTTWHHTERPVSSHADLLSSKWHFTTDSSIKSHPQTFHNGESDLFPSKGVILNSGNDSGARSHPLFKSSSSSQIPSGKGSSVQSMRQLKFNGEKPPSICSLPPAYAPALPQLRNNFCCCSNNCCKKTIRTESSLSLTDDVETPEGLSWRRLHMSRAKLKATATTSELLSGFAMVAMVELQINKPTAVPEWLFVLFAVCTTILVSVHIFALMISTYLLPNIDAVSKLHVSSLVTESPHDRMKSFIELAWAFSTILGLFLFLVEIAILCWVKFWDYSFTAAISATMIVIPVLILFVAFAIHFYHSLVVIKCKNSVYNMQELENIKRQLDNVSPA